MQKARTAKNPQYADVDAPQPPVLFQPAVGDTVILYFHRRPPIEGNVGLANETHGLPGFSFFLNHGSNARSHIFQVRSGNRAGWFLNHEKQVLEIRGVKISTAEEE